MKAYLLAWFGMVIIGIGNGVLRQATYGRVMSELAAHQLSTVVGIALMGVYMLFVVRHWPPHSAAQALLVGAMWAGLTIAFEFLFGRFIAHDSWATLLANYNVFAGRVWIAVLAWVAVAPWLFTKYVRA